MRSLRSAGCAFDGTDPADRSNEGHGVRLCLGQTRPMPPANTLTDLAVGLRPVDGGAPVGHTEVFEHGLEPSGPDVVHGAVGHDPLHGDAGARRRRPRCRRRTGRTSGPSRRAAPARTPCGCGRRWPHTSRSGSTDDPTSHESEPDTARRTPDRPTPDRPLPPRPEASSTQPAGPTPTTCVLRLPFSTVVASIRSPTGRGHHPLIRSRSPAPSTRETRWSQRLFATTLSGESKLAIARIGTLSGCAMSCARALLCA
jgi:hypothetical protein